MQANACTDSIRRDRGYSSFFFFNDTATTEIYTLSLHDALPIYARLRHRLGRDVGAQQRPLRAVRLELELAGIADRKSTRLNSSHLVISYAVFCLKKKSKGADHIAGIVN